MLAPEETVASRIVGSAEPEAVAGENAAGVAVEQSERQLSATDLMAIADPRHPLHHGNMTLTVGRGPFGHRPAGSFNFRPPPHVVYVEDFPRRVRAIKGGVTVVDSERVKMVHETGSLPHYAFPREDVQLDGATVEPHAEGHVQVPWNDVDAWFEEDDEVFVHPRDPYHRIDVLNTSRSIQVSLDGVVLAESTDARVLFETSLPPRYYLSPEDVRSDLLERSDTVTQCPYKGSARHWSVRVGEQVVPDVAWTYDDPLPEVAAVRDRICFYNERVDLDVDGLRVERPSTPWSR